MIEEKRARMALNVLLIMLILRNINATEVLFQENVMLANKITTNYRVGSAVVRSATECGVRCSFNTMCVSFFIPVLPGMCHLHSIMFSSHYPMSPSSGWNYYALKYLNVPQGKLPVDCKDIQTCSITQDGDYYIYPLSASPRTPVPIYCHSMSATPTEYISLRHANYVQSRQPNAACNGMITSVREWDKARIDIISWHVSRADFTFSSTPSNTNMQLGKAEDCVNAQDSSCVRPTAKIDLRGTGFIVKETVQWFSTGSGAEMRFRRTEGGAVITVECYATCGHCDITGGILELEYTGTNVTGDAEHVSC